MIFRAAILVFFSVAFSADISAAATAGAKIQFNVNDSANKPLPCRIHVYDKDGKPQAAFEQPFWHDHFVCSGRVALDVEPGVFHWEVERGPEYQRASGSVDVSSGTNGTVDVSLARIATLRNSGWYSGDVHVHRPVDEVPQLMHAEDLDFAPVIEWWNKPASGQKPLAKIDVQLADGKILRRMGGEDEREGGALLYFGLRQPLDLKVRSREFPSPFQFVSAARETNAETWIDIEKPFWWDVPTWLASGKMQSFGLANNHMCRSRMLENEAWGKPRDVARLPNPNGNGWWSQEVYYHALNAGLRIPPSAGSASGVLPNPVGYNRVYVQLGRDEFTADNWFSALAAGKCFVTNGPLLRVTANGQHAGHVFSIGDGAGGGETDNVSFEISLTSNDRIRSLEVIHNGRIIQKIPCSSDVDQTLSARVKISEPGWFLVRAIADVEETFRFASTAPWYVESSSVKHRISRPSAEFFVDWTKERMARIQKNVTNTEELRAVLKPHEEGLAFWQQRIAMANAELQDDAVSPVEKTSAAARALPSVQKVEVQPLLASVKRLVDAMELVGSPLPNDVIEKLSGLSALNDAEEVVSRVQELLDPFCLASVTVAKSGAPQVKAGTAKRELLEQGWRTFLVKVINPHERDRRLLIESPNAQPLPHAPASEVSSRWMQLSSFEGRPLKANLSGLGLEYRVIQIYSRDPGEKQAVLEFAVSSKAGDDSTLIREWRFEKGTDGWREMNQVGIEAKDASLFVTSTGEDPFIGADVEARGGPMLLRFWAKAETDGIGQFFWWTKDIPQATGDRQTNFLLEPGREHLYEVPFHVDGRLAGVRIDPLVKPGKMRIDWIDLYSAQRSKNWAKLPLTFKAVGANKVTFRILDDDGLPAFAKFEIRDAKGRIYPAQSKRLAPDFFFQRHIYRGDGESVSLQNGEYSITCSRGPETISETKTLTVNDRPAEIVYRVNRWVDPSQQGWWSGDHHIHAAGCLHYSNPTQGVQPNDMIRHIMGEDLKVGCCLTWGPCFDFQKRFFTGEVAEQSRYPYTLRYDVEVSGFGSHMSGHLNLLNLQEQIYPGGESKDHWPTLGLNTLRWAKKQGAVCGPAHSSIGLTRFLGRLPNTDGKDGPHDLPNFQLPTFDGIGANEFIVDVTHRVPGPEGKLVPAVDFISTMNTERVAEWNMWYHVLNCGFRVAASGETDFPCMSGERVGIGRVYAHVDGPLKFDKWVQSIATGRSYVSDGSCHLLDYSAQSSDGNLKPVDVGRDGGEVRLAGPGSVTFQLQAAARLAAQPDANRKTVELELIVNGYPVETKSFPADGTPTDVTFDIPIRQSSWVAVRAFPYAHTNPIYVTVDKQPIRGSVDSARWCLAGVEQCWKSKQNTYAQEEQADAKSAYEHARQVYKKLIAEYGQ